MTKAFKFSRGFVLDDWRPTYDEDLTAGMVHSIDEEIADGETDQEFSLPLTVAQIEAIYLVSDQDLTIETNSGSVPGDTISLLAGVPLQWSSGSYLACPFTVDVTAMYLTNASGAAATLSGIIGVDPTP